VTKRVAVFLDRDGTLIDDVGFVSHPDQVRLLPGAADGVAQLAAAGYLAVVVTNQSGIARGLFDWPAYHAVAARLDGLLAAAGARLDATYVCPHHPDFTGPCGCRKPKLQLYRQAAEALDLDLGGSIWIGDRVRDVEPSRAFGARGVLIRRPGATASHGPTAEEPGEFPLATDLPGAVRLALGR
jgi:D-glycero-D-manno-heptose 1,7-bisphosphate phosphatase